MLILPKLTSRFSAISIKIPHFFEEINKMILKYIKTYKVSRIGKSFEILSRIAKISLKRLLNNILKYFLFGELTLSHLKSNKVTIIKTNVVLV